MLMHSNPLMRSSAAFAIGELTKLSKRDVLMDDWKKLSPDVKQFLAELQETVPMLVSLLKDSDLSVKRQAIIALGKIKDRSAVLPILNHKSSPALLARWAISINSALAISAKASQALGATG